MFKWFKPTQRHHHDANTPRPRSSSPTCPPPSIAGEMSKPSKPMSASKKRKAGPGPSVASGSTLDDLTALTTAQLYSLSSRRHRDESLGNVRRAQEERDRAYLSLVSSGRLVFVSRFLRQGRPGPARPTRGGSRAPASDRVVCANRRLTSRRSAVVGGRAEQVCWVGRSRTPVPISVTVHSPRCVHFAGTEPALAREGK